jgi:hypothetical protein
LADRPHGMGRVRPPDDGLDRDMVSRYQEVHGNQDRCIEYRSSRRTPRDRICSLEYVVTLIC